MGRVGLVSTLKDLMSEEPLSGTSCPPAALLPWCWAWWCARALYGDEGLDELRFRRIVESGGLQLIPRLPN